MVRELLSAGISVTATSRQPTRRVETELGVALVQLDVLDPSFDKVAVHSADCLIHCATANDIASKNQSLGFELSVMGTWNMLRFAAVRSIPKLIYFSTFQVYGTELTGVVDESRPANCQSPYGLNHWCGEEVCRMQATMQALAVAVVRPSNVYGAPAASSVNRNTLVPACFVSDALAHGEIRLQSSGRQLRNFVSTAEVARACLHLLADFPSGFSISNICSPYSATIYDVALLTAEVHRERFGVTLPVKVLRNEPTVINGFDARSRHQAIWGTADASRKTMRQEIRLLYDWMQQTSPDITN